MVLFVRPTPFPSGRATLPALAIRERPEMFSSDVAHDAELAAPPIDPTPSGACARRHAAAFGEGENASRGEGA